MTEGGAPVVDVALAIPVRGGRVLVARRADDAHLGGTWEFPGGKLGSSEDAAAAAGRELAEETGLTAEVLEPLLVVAHDYPDRAVRLHCFVAREPDGRVRVDGHREWAWVTLEDLETLAMPAGNAPVLRALRWRMGNA